jgi:hypothetical protein
LAVAAVAAVVDKAVAVVVLAAVDNSSLRDRA